MSLIVHSIDSGRQILDTLEELNCDHLESCDDFIITRCSEGKTVYVWRYYQDKDEL